MKNDNRSRQWEEDRTSPCQAVPLLSHAAPPRRCPQPSHCDAPHCATSVRQVIPQHLAADSLPKRRTCHADTLRHNVPCLGITTTLPPCPVVSQLHTTCFPHQPAAALSAALSLAVSRRAAPPRRNSAVPHHPIAVLSTATTLPHTASIIILSLFLFCETT